MYFAAESLAAPAGARCPHDGPVVAGSPVFRMVDAPVCIGANLILWHFHSTACLAAWARAQAADVERSLGAAWRSKPPRWDDLTEERRRAFVELAAWADRQQGRPTAPGVPSPSG